MRVLLAVLLVMVALLSLPAPSSASDLPVTEQAVFLLRVLAYDRNLKMRTPEAASILLAYQGGNDSSEATKNALIGEINRLAKDLRVADLPVRVTPIAYTTLDDLDAALGRAKASALFVCPGLESSVPIISTVTRRRSALTFTGVEVWARQSLAIGLVARGDKPTVIVNLRASKAEGADLDPALLRIAEVVR
jgi:hypothetical protein